MMARKPVTYAIYAPETNAEPDCTDIDPTTGDSDRLMDELDAEAREHGYHGAGDPGFRVSLDPRLKRARRTPANFTRRGPDDQDDDL